MGSKNITEWNNFNAVIHDVFRHNYKISQYICNIITYSQSRIYFVFRVVNVPSLAQQWIYIDHGFFPPLSPYFTQRK